MSDLREDEGGLFTPYKSFAILPLIEDSGSGSSSLTIPVQIQTIKQPWTLSCGMTVTRLETLSHSSVAFLKLYDRRFAFQLREDNGVDPWSDSMESSCLQFVEEGKDVEFAEKLRTDQSFKEQTEEHWNAAENEAFLAYELSRLYETEKMIYHKLRHHQGFLFPTFFAGTVLEIAPKTAPQSKSSYLYRVNGILIQHISGFSLRSISSAPRSAWQDIIDQAIHIVHVLGDNNILNADVRPDNFIVEARGDERFRVYMIDLAQCRIRRDDESDSEWGRAKWRQDEEGAVGLVMKHMLAKEGFELQFQHSLRYYEFAERE